jgi:hypothetical protein
VEKAGLLSKAEKAGLLSAIEKNGLLSFAEKSGLLKVAADPSTPASLTASGALLLAGAVSLVYGAGDSLAIDAAAAAVGIAGLASIAGGAAIGVAQEL